MQMSMSQNNNPLPSTKVTGAKGPFVSDLLASFVVFLVALPLSVGIAVASGATPMSGILGAIVGGLVVGLLSGAPLQVSGPAAGLTVLVFGAVEKYGFENLFVITVLAGFFQIVASSTRCADWIAKIPHAVVDGMLSGIGLLIASSQLVVVLGGQSQGSFSKNILAIWNHISNLNLASFLLGAGVFLLLLLWKKLPGRIPQFIPGPLVGLLCGAWVAFGAESWGFISANALAKLQISGSLFSAVGLPDWHGFLNPQLYFAGLIFALIASTESLLCAVATDKLHGGPPAHLRKELFAQGMGNTVSGLIGGLPVTGVIVRSYANITAGAQTRLSAMLHGVWLLVFVGAFGAFLKYIPMAAMAGLLVFVGYNLIQFRYVKTLFKNASGLSFAATFVGCVALDLLSGVMIGLVTYFLITLRAPKPVSKFPETTAGNPTVPPIKPQR